ncbi:MAG: type II secretion system F family protein [Actinomycetia bacterium]|nr:type II secretion system F family protein [Actinomycetes bacterium]
MTFVTVAVVAAVGITMLPRTWGWVLVGASTLVVQPVLGVAVVALGVAGYRVRNIVRERHSAAATLDDEQLLVDLVGLGVIAGLSFDQASLQAAGHVRGPVGERVARAVRRSRAGLAPDIDPGSVAAMFAAAQRTTDSGAPLATTLIDMARDRREEASSRENERLEKLPVKLLFPLALLILPGFVLVAVVPTVVSGLSRLGL